MRRELLSRVQRLSLLVMISGSLNIFMAALLCFFYFKEHPPAPIYEGMPYSEGRKSVVAIETSNSDLIRFFASLSMEQLVEKLQDKRLANDGFSCRDLALGCLVTIHHFDIVKALKGDKAPEQRRMIAYHDRQGGRHEIATYSDLNEGHYSKIINFAKTEEWPLTPKGLFLTLKEQGESADKSLRYAFYLTPEFLIAELLLKRANVNISKQELLTFLTEGSWELLSDFSAKQCISQSLTHEDRRQFLTSYIEQGSIMAAELLLKTDPHYAAKKLDDEQVLALLKLAGKRTPEAARFALEMLVSPRQDKVWQEAAKRLYEFAGEKEPGSFDRNQVLERFLPVAVRQKENVSLKKAENMTVKNSEEPKPAKLAYKIGAKAYDEKTVGKIIEGKKAHSAVEKWKCAYTIKEGDSLWKIARLFNVEIEELKRRNNLFSDTLTPGTMIMVP